MGWLFIVVPLAIIVGLFWYYRHKVKAREAASNERFKMLLDSVRQGKADSSTKVSGAAVAPIVSPPKANAATVQRPAEYLARSQLLSPQLSVVYYLLAGALPEHKIFVRVSLGALLEVAPGSSGFERETRETRLTAQVDFVVCDEGLRVMAVVNASENQPALRAACEGAGVRWVDIAPAALPSKDAMRAAIFGKNQ